MCRTQTRHGWVACVTGNFGGSYGSKNDALGCDIIDDLYAIFRREREEGVEPVGKKDVAEVLRRRFFTPDSLKNKDGFRKHVIEALNGIEGLDDETKKSRKDAQSGAAPASHAPASDTRASVEVALKPNQLQDFVDVLPAILKATAGSEMSFRMTVEIKGKDRPSDKTVANINKLLKSVDENLMVR